MTKAIIRGANPSWSSISLEPLSAAVPEGAPAPRRRHPDRAGQRRGRSKVGLRARRAGATLGPDRDDRVPALRRRRVPGGDPPRPRTSRSWTRSSRRRPAAAARASHWEVSARIHSGETLEDRRQPLPARGGHGAGRRAGASRGAEPPRLAAVGAGAGGARRRARGPARPARVQREAAPHRHLRRAARRGGGGPAPHQPTTEGADFRLGCPQVRAEIAVEADPLGVACGCREAREGPCPHAVSAVDAALDLLRDPAGQRGKLAAVLAIPVWQRFLRAFGDELVRREGPTRSDDARLAWRVIGEGRVVAIEPLLQKRLKGGGFSQGGRVRLDEVLARRELLADPRDARAVDALGSGPDEPYAMARMPLLRSRSVRALEALIGHARVFLDARPGASVRVTRERLRARPRAPGTPATPACWCRSSSASAATRRLRSGLTLADGAEQVISVDAAQGAVALCSLDARAQALLAAFAQHPARFPPESHDDLVRARWPPRRAVRADPCPRRSRARPSREDAPPGAAALAARHGRGVDVDVLVRLGRGRPALPAGREGPEAVLHATRRAGVLDRAGRDRAREASAAAIVMAGTLTPSGVGAGRGLAVDLPPRRGGDARPAGRAPRARRRRGGGGVARAREAPLAHRQPVAEGAAHPRHRSARLVRRGGRDRGRRRAGAAPGAARRRAPRPPLPARGLRAASPRSRTTSAGGWPRPTTCSTRAARASRSRSPASR